MTAFGAVGHNALLEQSIYIPSSTNIAQRQISTQQIPTNNQMFTSFQSGAPTLSGTAGDLAAVLSHCLVIGKVFSTTDDSTFTNNTAEARLTGGTNFKLFPTPHANDRTYVGHSGQFTSITFDFQTLGSSATYVWEYWNGSAWSTLTVEDRTSGFTSSSMVRWRVPSDWATKSVNNVTMYWVRVRISGSVPVTNPLVYSMTYLGWLEYYNFNNRVAYRQGLGPGTSLAYFLRVNDQGNHAGADESLGASFANASFVEARLRGYETMEWVDVGTNPFPLNAQLGFGCVARKSATADTLARPWVFIGDARTFYLFVLTGDSTGIYLGFMFGDIFTYKSGDPWRCMIIGRNTETSANTTTVEGLSLVNALGAASVGHYMARNEQGTGDGTTATSPAMGKIGGGYGSATALLGTLARANPSDHKLYVSPLYVNGTTSASQLRGRLRGFYQWTHAVTNCSDGDTFLGTDALTGRTFQVLKSAGNSGVFLIEISNTWDTNTS